MRFRLFEANSTFVPTREEIQNVRNASTMSERINYIKQEILSKPELKRFSGISNLLLQSILDYGLDLDDNRFLKFVTKLPFDIKDNRKYMDKFKYIYLASKNKKIDFSLKYLYNPSLYDRSFNETKYAINSFVTVNDRNYINKTFKNTKGISDKYFYMGNKVKKSGIHNEKGDTIYNQWDKWSANGNEYSAEEKDKSSDRMRTNLATIIPKKKLNFDSLYEIVNRRFDDIARDFNIDISEKEELINNLFYIFKVPEVINLLQKGEITPTFSANGKQDALNDAENSDSKASPGSLITYSVGDEYRTELVFNDITYLLEVNQNSNSTENKKLQKKLLDTSIKLQNNVLNSEFIISNDYKSDDKIVAGLISAILVPEDDNT